MNTHVCTIQHTLSAVAALLMAIVLTAGCNDNPTSPAVVAADAVSPTAPNPPTTGPTRSPAPVTPALTDTPPAQTRTPAPTRTALASPHPTSANTATAAPISSSLATRSPAGVEISESILTLPTYPYRDYLIEQADPVYNMPVFYFNRPLFEADSPAPVAQDYKTVVLENPYLRLTFLPELGGRLYGATIKATGQELFYHNPVVKPSRYGVLQPVEANWWLAVGGMEWAYPTQEHGYRFGVPWKYRATQTPDGAAITLIDAGPGRVGLAVTVALAANSTSFTVEPVLTNRGSAAAPVQVWSNAALTLASGSMSADTQFVAATDVITVHSRGEAGWAIPGPGLHAPWPQVGQTDLRDYRQWANYLGFFVDNQAAPFLAAVNPNSRLGMVRLGPPDFPGSAGKLFAFGPDFPYRDYTDDGSQYFEIWGGANAAFWPDYDRTVQAGQSLGWREVWWPLAGLDGLTWATAQAAIDVQPKPQTSDGYTLSALLAQPTRGQVQVTSGGNIVLAEPFETAPNTPLMWEFNAARGPINIELTNQQHQTLLNYQFE